MNYPHHITQRGNNQRDVFFDGEDKAFYLKTFSGYSKKWGLDIWAYCLMTNHVHIIVTPEQEKSLARGIGGTNLVYTQYINRGQRSEVREQRAEFFADFCLLTSDPS